MIAISHNPLMTFQEYLKWETQQDCKYEYVGGEVYAMTGGTIPHSAIAVNLLAALRPHVRGRSCQVLSSDAKVAISETGPGFYPDLSVTCDSRDQEAIEAIRYPCIIVEVLSPSTESYDRGAKFAHYRCLKSLREYVLVSSDRMNVEIFRLNERKKWELTPYAAGETLQLISLDFECPIELLYEDVKFSPQDNDAIRTASSS
ncbi:Uma2 family endonuclease [Leptolyngbya sp. FACHB-711]|uniref:Uma2 family endonuclease n=1 Tax=unclassified Leptolyngbya TaxID=2650499 RepID=UPI0016867387|nr:Uma2 family endonuclease [Leptolyngbya sp. FACHB-711]MBD2025106.1 Uma2 family endonuclease [Leptolyngbya sp. FACHB-711]